MNNLTVNERLIQIVVGVILALILLLMILIGIRKKIIARRRAHEGSSDSQDHESKTEKRLDGERKNSLPSYEDCVKEKTSCPDYTFVHSQE